MSKTNKTLVWTFIITLIGAVIPICYTLCTTEHKELTIQEERQIDFLNKSNGSLALICNDSIKIDKHDYIVEYSIVNTGNTTIIGFGPNSDLLTVDNTLSIASDSIIVKLYENNHSITLDNNLIRFKQIRPGEKISLICITNKKTDSSLVRINDRDIKDTNIIYAKRSDQLTTFEKTTSTNRWIAVVGFLLNLLMILFLIIIGSLDFIKRNPFRLAFMILWVISLLYTMSLPLRWLL